MANWVNWGWKLIQVTVALWPYIWNFAGVLGRYKSLIFVLLGSPWPPVLRSLATYYYRAAFCYYNVAIFFCKVRIDFHLISNFFPSESIYSMLLSIYSANRVAVFL